MYNFDMSITLYTAAWGGYWEKYGETWTKNIKKLNPQPDKIIIISDKLIDSEFEVLVTDRPKSEIIAHFRNFALQNINTTHVAALDLDDEPYPNLLSNINYDYDINAFSYISENGTEYHFNKDIWDNLLEFDHYVFPNTPSSSLIRVQAIKDCGGYPDLEYEDAGLWLKMKIANKSIYSNNQVRFIYKEVSNSLSRANAEKNTNQLNQYIRKIKSENYL